MPNLVFLFDVDNTLLDNDRVTADLKRHLEQQVGPERQQHYWDFFEQLRTELGYADYLGALQRYRLEYPRDPSLLTVSHFLINYPFATRLYPKALAVLMRLCSLGPTAILSDGDVVFQPRKVEHAGIAKVVDGDVLIYIHKEEALEDGERRFPAKHYVLGDDKLRILDAVKKVWGERVTTVLPRQGQYAHDAKVIAALPPADVTIEHIGALLDYDLARLGATPRALESSLKVTR